MHKINSYVVLFVLVVSTVLIGMSYGQTSYPMVMSTYPVAVPSGEVTEVEVKGRYNFYGAYKVLFPGPEFRLKWFRQKSKKIRRIRTRSRLFLHLNCECVFEKMLI